VTGCCECGNESPGYMKYGEFIEYLWNLACPEGLCSVRLAGCLVGWLVS
jgi:hypothetical protein